MTASLGLRGQQLLCRLAAAGISLTLVRSSASEGEDKLIAKPTAAITSEILAEIRVNKGMLIEALRAAPQQAPREAEAASELAELPAFIQRGLIRASDLGLVAKWSRTFGYISLHDPTSGERHDINTEDAAGWMKREAGKRKELWRKGDRRAFDLTAREMSEIWEAEHPPLADEGIVEDTPLPDD